VSNSRTPESFTMPSLQVVVAESSVARFYRSVDETRHLELIDTLANPAARAREQDLVSSRQGRMVDRGVGHTVSFGARHSARETALERHAYRVARRIGAPGTRTPGDRLVLIASGRLLTLIRKHLSVASEKRLVAEIPKDLTHLDPRGLEEAVAGIAR
jgi:protein required for attachment to host cells